MQVRVRLKHKELARLLAQSNLTQNHWAQRFGLNKGHLSQLVNGKRPYPSARTRSKLLAGLDVPFEQLFVLEEENRMTSNQPKSTHTNFAKSDLDRHPGEGIMSGFLQDVRHSFRGLLRSPMFSTVAIVTLAVGIGANTAIFSVLDAVLLRPFPFPEVDRLVVLAEEHPGLEAHAGMSAANFYDLHRHVEHLSTMALIEPYSHDYYEGQYPQTLISGLVSEQFFDVWGTPALIGRVLTADDFEAGRDNVIVLSYGLWQRLLGGSDHIVGQEIRLDGETYTIVGVMPPSFRPRLFDMERLMWLPRIPRHWDEEGRGETYMKSVGRLRDGSSLQVAQQELTRVAAQLANAHPQVNRDLHFDVRSFSDDQLGSVRIPLLLMAAAVGCVLLIACANVASLLLSRNATREDTLGIRVALGATRTQLLRFLLSESLVISFLGLLLGSLLAYAGVRIVTAYGAAFVPRLEELSFGWNIFIFCVGLMTATTLLFGLGPTLKICGRRFRYFGTSRQLLGGSGIGMRRALILAEVGLATLLVVGAGLLARSFFELLSEDPGFRSRNVAAIQVFAYDRQRTAEQRRIFFHQVETEIRSVPEIHTVGLVSALPFFGSSAIEIVSAFEETGSEAVEDVRQSAFVIISDDDYFSVMGIPLRKGRFFAEDRAGSQPVALINQKLADSVWPGQDPLGRRIIVDFGSRLEREVIGVVGDILHTGLDSSPRPEIYFPFDQVPYAGMTLVVGTSSPASEVLSQMREAIWRVDPLQTIYAEGTVEKFIAETVADRKLSLFLAGTLSLIALLLAAVGIYGLISFSTQTRRGEIGLRMALGAGRYEILKMVAVEGVWPSLVGVFLGILAAVNLSHFMSSLLYGIRPQDPWTLGGAVLLLLVVAVSASWIPAYRASRTDPMEVLRTD